MWPFKKKAPVAQVGAPFGNFTLQAQLAGASGRTMAIQGVIYEGESAESLNDRLDVLQEVIERQRVRCEIPELEAKRDQMLKGIGQAREVLADLEERSKTGTLSSQERMNVRNMRTNIEKAIKDVGDGEKAIAEAKKKAGVG